MPLDYGHSYQGRGVGGNNRPIRVVDVYCGITKTLFGQYNGLLECEKAVNVSKRIISKYCLMNRIAYIEDCKVHKNKYIFKYKD